MTPPRHSYWSPLRYPGGKAALANFVKLLLQRNALADGHYVEVFAGGAGIAWSLLFEEYVHHVSINDISRPLYAFWRSVLLETEGLCRLIRDTPVTMQEWHVQKAKQSDPSNHSLLELGFSTFFLNRTNRSGILQGGVIGGKAQSGVWKLDARFNKQDLISRIHRIARYAGRVSLHNLDAACFIAQVLPALPPKAFVYLDPPYYVKGKELYENHYSHDDHVQLASLISDAIQQPWIVTYDATPETTALYSRFRSIRYDVSYSAQNVYSASEIMFFSRNLALPENTTGCATSQPPALGTPIHPARVRRADLLLQPK